MKFIKSPFIVEVKPIENETVIFRITIVDHLNEEQIEQAISDLEITMLEGFIESFESLENALIGLDFFKDKKCFERIPDEQMPLVDEREFSLKELLVEGLAEKTLFINDMFRSAGGFLTEKTLIYADAFRFIRPHLSWIDCWNIAPNEVITYFNPKD